MEDAVAEIAPEESVHRMHAVQVDDQDREACVRARLARDGGEALLEGLPARQPREGIERHYQHGA
jgi:hypothetical protein